MNRWRRGWFTLLAVGLALNAAGATVAVDSDSVGMGTVAWSEKIQKDGTVKLTVKATAAEGYAFAGWSVAETNVVAWPDDLRYPGPLTASVSSNAEVVATFIPCAEDGLSFDVAMAFPDEFSPGEDVMLSLDIESGSFPTVTFRNLPDGLYFNERTLSIFGTPDEPGLYRIEAHAVNGSGFSYGSFATVRVANLEGPRISGADTDVALDAYFYSEIGRGDFSDIFSFSEPPTSVTLRGSVPGLEWRSDWQLLYGTPTQAGTYTLTAVANFPTGRVETATLLLTVAGADPSEYGLDPGVLENLQVGDVLEDELGADASDHAILSVTGLPTGLKASSRYADGVRRWYVSGRVAQPGFFTPTVRIDERGAETQRVVKAIWTVDVADVPDVYLSAVSSDPTRGTVSGGGAVSPFADVTLVANARTGFVFSGWYDDEGEPLVLQEGVDFRTSSVTLPAETDFAFLEPVAHFTSEADDASPDLSELEDAEFSFAPDEAFDTEFSVESLSLPTLSFKGLPKGTACTATGAGGFVLAYDPQTSVAASGRYAVTATAVNASGRRSTVTFRITVEPRSDARINVYDDYGECLPGEEMEPIDLSDAVDFARGETLTVSGLPKGLAYNAKANEKKGIEAHTITGTPTAPGDYTLTFSARVVSGATTNKSGKVSYRYETAKATAFITVLPYPELAIDVDEDAAAAGCKVTGTGNYKAGTKVSLKATAAKGWVFAGWEGLDGLDGLAALNPKLSYVTGEDDVWAQACFVPVSEDGLTVYEPELTESGYAAEWALKESLGDDEAALIANLIETVSWPTVKVDGLPSGVKFTAATFLLSGKPTKSGVFHVTVTAKNTGGYSFVRVIDVAVRNADGSLPAEKALANAAEIDFSPLGGLMTGSHCPTGAVVLAVGPKPETGSAVKKVAVSGLPAGLTVATRLNGDGALVEVTGTPTKPGRFVVTVTVTYGDGKSLKSQTSFVVADGGSRYLFVAADDDEDGTVTGEGVYAAGATVKLAAVAAKKRVFAGWCVTDAAGELSLFEPLRDKDDIDPRTAKVAFTFRPADFAGICELTGVFADATEDAASVVETEDETWEIDLVAASSFGFAVDSLSVPKVTVTGLPKGVTVDVARGILVYEPTAAIAAGDYTVKITSKNVTQSKATVKTFIIRVSEMPATLGGTFTGVLTDAEGAVVGTVTVTATAVGKVTVAAKTAAKSLSFTSKIWDAYADGVATVSLDGKNESACDLSVAATDDWQSWQATGTVVLERGADPLVFTAQRNPYGKKDGFADAKKAASEMAGTSVIEEWSIKIKAAGTVAIAGKYEGKSVSGSTVLQWNSGGSFAQYVKFIDKKSLVYLVFQFDEEGQAISWRAEK